MIRASQITLSDNATTAAGGIALKFGGTFAGPIEIFDFDPVANTISPVSPALNDSYLTSIQAHAYVIGMLMLPTGQVLFSDGSNQLWAYTPDGAASPSLLPVVTSIDSKGKGAFTLHGTQLNGQSSGAAYGDDEQNDSSYPVTSMTSASGNVYYAKTTNWSYVGVGGGSTPQSVDFTLNSQLTAGTYSLIVSGAGIQSTPVPVAISSDLNTITLSPTPVISAVTDAASARASLVPGQWVAIYGQKLANSARMWGDSDFSGGVTAGSPLPTKLDGVSVSIGSQAAAVYFISATQINVQVPAGLASGSAAVVVTNNGSMSAPFQVTITQSAPSFYSYASGSVHYPAALHLNGALVGDPAASPPGEPGHPGDVISFYVSGLGPAPAGAILGPAAFMQPVTITAGSSILRYLGPRWWLRASFR